MNSEKDVPVEPRFTHARSRQSLALEIHLDSSSEEEFQDLESSRHPSHVMGKTVTAQDWTGPDDPENPHNWPMRKRAFHTVTPALFGFAVTFGSSAYSPAVQDIAKNFGVSTVVSYLGVTLWVLGLAFGPVIAAPASETWGRQIVYRVSLPTSMLFTLGGGFSKSFASLMVCRFFAGLAGSTVLSVGAGTNADLFPPRQRAAATISFLLAPFLGTAIAPVVNGYAVMYKGWRWSQWTILFLSLVVWIISLPTHETYKKVILQRRAKRLGIEPPKSTLPGGLQGLKFLLTVTLFRPVHMLLFEPIVLFLSLYSAFIFGVLFAFLPAFPIVFIGVYKFNLGEAGLAFLPLGIGYIFAVPTAIACDFWIYQPLHRKAMKEGRHMVDPEHRLYSAMMGSLGVTVGLFWFGWTARASIHWIVPMIGVIPFAWGNLCVFTASALYVVDVYGPLNGASAIGANGLARYAFAAAFPLFTAQMYHKLGIAWASSLLGFASLVMLPIPFVLFKYGPKIRSKSHYETMKAF